ncbi:nucleoside 2-deoxyribosyltransferase [Roseomonas sp. CCTCC AB2023176]|uniref:nucleoside 2-deoxyribosyltransferase n=1 Tax=Roseomonas sp. CCTCC AB2023176 TaxID=3342640 RepID=UPI0035E2A78D
MTIRIYLAGPEVFLADAVAAGEAKKAVCARHGAVGVFPLDPIDSALADAQADRWYAIYLRNEAHIRSCDALVANLTPFRGPSGDAGTVYELGFMRALGRPVAAYSTVAAPFTERTRAFLGDAARRRADGEWEDAEGLSLESFGLTDNLMLDGGVRASGGIVAVRDVPDAARWTDLAAFEEAVRAIVAACAHG